MRTYTTKDLSEYLANDWILSLLCENEAEWEKDIRTHQWLLEMDNKRMICSDVYGDRLREKSSLKVLDVGGGYSSLTKVLAQHTNYTLLDFMAHGGVLNSYLKEYGINWLNMDWYDCEEPGDYDIIIANDIFPDVDQRLELFIDKMLPHCSELRLVVTYYNHPRFYTTRRIDDTELLTFLSWDGEITGLKLRKYISRSNLTEVEIEEMKYLTDSIYWNMRQVSYLVIKGDLSSYTRE